MRISDTDYHLKILIVDADPASVQRVSEILTREDYSILTAFDSQQVLDNAEKYLPDLILLNATMPDYDGFKLTRILKNSPTTENIPIIILAAYLDSEIIQKGFDAGADEFLNTPVNSAELLARVRSVLKLKIYQEQLRIRKKIQSDFADNRIAKKEMPIENKSEFDHILLVEDDLKDAKLIKAILNNDKAIFTVVETGEKAIALALNNKFDLIILDVLLPDMNGLEVYEQIKQMHAYQYVPVVFVTGISDHEFKIRCLELEADDFFVKPINGMEFKAKIQSLLKNKIYVEKLEGYYQNAVDSAIKDGLTGLYKRSYFIMCLEQEIKRINRHQDCLSVMMIDIDNFKIYNDTLGHLGGDIILREVGKIILENIREIDVAARFGGEEFIILLINIGKENSLIIAQRIQSALAGLSLPSKLSSRIDKLTVSIGIADFPYSSKSSSDLLNKADLMLYEAKKTGKNKACLSNN
jgi:two-component system cell cycle response regulator